jgi:hypothetical protein
VAAGPVGRPLVDVVEPPVLPSVPGAGIGELVLLGLDPGEAGAIVEDGAVVDEGLPLDDEAPPLEDEEPPPEDDPDWAKAALATRPPATMTADMVR